MRELAMNSAAQRVAEFATVSIALPTMLSAIARSQFDF
jgi:hypothetical protein